MFFDGDASYFHTHVKYAEFIWRWNYLAIVQCIWVVICWVRWSNRWRVLWEKPLWFSQSILPGDICAPVNRNFFDIMIKGHHKKNIKVFYCVDVSSLQTQIRHSTVHIDTVCTFLEMMNKWIKNTKIFTIFKPANMDIYPDGDILGQYSSCQMQFRLLIVMHLFVAELGIEVCHTVRSRILLWSL